MYSCFFVSFPTIDQLSLHMKFYHNNLDSESVYCCKQGGCSKVFQGLDKFRRHLNQVHSVTNPISGFSTHSHKASKDILIDVTSCNESPPGFQVPLVVSDGKEKDIIFTTFDDVVKCSVLKFITKSSSKSNMTSSLMQDIIDETTELFSFGIISKLKAKLSPFLDNNSNQSEISEIYNMFSVLENPFLNFKTEYQRIKYFESNNLYFKPKTVVVGFTKEKKVVDGVERQVMVQAQGHLFCIKENLKKIFELPGVFDLAHQYTITSLNNSNISSFLNVTTWKNIIKNFKDKIVFPIFLYYDDAEMGNPLGSHSGVHKMGCVYYTVPALPPEYLSLLKTFSLHFYFTHLIEGLKILVMNLCFLPS